MGLTPEPDLYDNRDPNGLNEHCKTGFSDIIGEPDGAHSIKCVFCCAYFWYSCCWACVYNILMIFLAIPISCWWGCSFAFIALNHIWVITPLTRFCEIECGCAQKFFGTAISCCCAPIMETCGLVFSKIKVTNG